MRPFRPRDRLWLLALPVYLSILIVRHEASHAAVAVTFDDARVTSYAVLPRIVDGEFVRPHVRVSGRVSWLSRFAPYAGDALLFAVCLPICLAATRWPKWVWLNLVIVGVASPLLDSAGNYVIGLVRPQSDVGRLLTTWPPVAVHAYFLVTVATYAIGTGVLIRRARSLAGAGTPERAPSVFRS